MHILGVKNDTLMARIAKNKLTLSTLSTGGFLLSGYVNGKQLRKRSQNAHELESLKLKLEGDLETEAQISSIREKARNTWLSPEQLAEAEAYFREFRNPTHSLLDYVRAGSTVLAQAVSMTIKDAMDQWLANKKGIRELSQITIKESKNRVERFCAFSDLHMEKTPNAKASLIGEITTSMIEKFYTDGSVTLVSRISRTKQLKAFLNYCVSKKWLKNSPFEIDLSEAAEKAARKRKERPKILTPGQCAKLLEVACESYQAHVPYVILATWCFMRHAEILRLTPADVRINGKTLVEIRPLKTGTVSYRTVTVPANVAALLKDCIDRKLWKEKKAPFWTVSHFANLRADAGLIKQGERIGNLKRAVINLHWQPNILRHTGISYFHQECGDMKEVTRQAGNSEQVAFAEYLNIPVDGESKAFYSVAGVLTEAPVVKMEACA